MTKKVNLQIGGTTLTVYDPSEINDLKAEILNLKATVARLEEIIDSYNEEDEPEQGSH